MMTSFCHYIFALIIFHTAIDFVEGQASQQDVHEAERLHAEFEEIHKNDPKDPVELARKTLYKLFDMNNNGKSVMNAMTLMQKIGDTYGEPRLHIMRIFELMDTNLDGEISNHEFVAFYEGPVAYPDKSISMMFKVDDYDGNGEITCWEMFRGILMEHGLDNSIKIAWELAEKKTMDMDLDQSGTISLTEYQLFMVYQVDVALFLQKYMLKEQP